MLLLLSLFLLCVVVIIVSKLLHLQFYDGSLLPTAAADETNEKLSNDDLRLQGITVAVSTRS